MKERLAQGEQNPHKAETGGRVVDGVLPYFYRSAQLAGVHEYNHKQTLYSMSTIRKMLYIEPSLLQ